MKKLVFVAMLSCLFCSFKSSNCVQCNVEQYTEKGIKKLSIEGGYTFLKSYPVSGQEGKKYSYIFSHGTHYMITLANNDSNSKGIYITLFDSNNKEVASSYKDGKFYPAIAFTCKSTGIYHLKFGFEHTNDYCAVGVLGMKR
jgi:hypothetical protein